MAFYLSEIILSITPCSKAGSRYFLRKAADGIDAAFDAAFVQGLRPRKEGKGILVV